ncbi:lipase 1-like [Leptopilina heterotoma]|uniref:lipase 1-like n=1 Tax=Leptopilina heterotoma TaxID=63436 RepID=UPI001CA89E91|nr:lipase 1-like [Leptopilina heterotoma]
MKNSWPLSVAFILIICVVNSYEDATVYIRNFVTGRGYPFQAYHVTTKDGYILELHRIPGGRANNKTTAVSNLQKPAVLINHGLADSSAAFLFAETNQSLAYILADNGYDVWLGNHRGNRFSRKHKTLVSYGFKFWNFSFHEIGLYDHPAMIDFILKETKEKRLFHVCHSEGCTELFVMASLRPEYNQKIKLSVNLSPSVLYGHAPLTLRSVFMFSYLLQEVFGRLGYIKVLDKNFVTTLITRLVCKRGSFTQYICYIIVSLIHGFDWFATDTNLLSQYLEVYPAGTSVKEIIHYGFLYFYPGTFRQFDYGDCRNREIYNSTMPPEYPLRKATLPVAVFYGENDNLGPVKDVRQFSKMIPNVIEGTYLKSFNHLGYFLRADIKKLVYNRILQLFTNH